MWQDFSIKTIVIVMQWCTYLVSVILNNALDMSKNSWNLSFINWG